MKNRRQQDNKIKDDDFRGYSLGSQNFPRATPLYNIIHIYYDVLGQGGGKCICLAWGMGAQRSPGSL